MEGYSKVPHSFARSDLGLSAKGVCLYLYSRQGTNANAWPSIRRISSDLGISNTTVQRAIKVLKKEGYLCVTRSTGFRELNRYSVTLLKNPCNRNDYERKNNKEYTL